MFERRLYFHFDWLLLGGDPADHRDRHRDDLQHDLRDAARAAATPDRRSGRRSTRWSSASSPSSSSCRSTTGCWPSTRCSSTAGCARCCCSCSSRARPRWARSAGSRSARSTSSPPSSAGSSLALSWRCSSARTGAARATPATWSIGGIFTGVPLLLIAKQPDLGHRGDADPGLPRRSPTSPACGCGCSASSPSPRRAGGAGCVEVRAEGLSEGPHHDVPRPGAGSARRGLPADPGPDHGRIGRADRQRLPRRHPGAVQVPAGGAQRFHLLGPGRRAGVSRRARGPRACICS